MKRNEIALLIIIVGLASLASYFTLNAVIGSIVSTKDQMVKKATLMSSKVDAPDSTVFKATAYNPTVKVKIGDQANRQPFSGQ